MNDSRSTTSPAHSADNPPLISALLNLQFYSPPVKTCQLIETHISWVILTDVFVYKIKKPVNLGFVDFSTLEKRKYYCEEELRLNRRLAPDIYLEVIKITGSGNNPELSGNGNAIEYAVKMLPFSQHMQLDHVLARNELRPDMVDDIAALIAAFHLQIEAANATADFGQPESVYQPVKENFIQIRERLSDKSKTEYHSVLTELAQWSDDTFKKITNTLNQRKEKGFIRECHGDLHLRNLAWYKDKPLAFDCLEFNPNFRWIDVISEVAFLVMDLDDHNQPELAQRFLNRYLELSGDYAGCHVLRFYLVYRAMVRAKVVAIRAHQENITQQESDEANNEFHNYLQLALSYTRQQTPVLIITHGMSASGKSTLSQPLLETLDAIRIRSDIERKRLFSVTSEDDSHANAGEGIYTKDATRKTYLKLLQLAEEVLDAGYPVIVDATFSHTEQRDLFKDLALNKQVRFIILDFVASNETLKQRIQSRKQEASDADIRILEYQIEHWLPLTPDEKKYTLAINTEETFDINQIVSRLKPI